MSARMIVELPNGNKVLFGGGGTVSGLSEVGVGRGVAKASSAQFKAALGSLADLAAVLEQTIGKMPQRPEKVELEFGASLTGECDLWIVSGDSKAELKVKFTWGKGE